MIAWRLLQDGGSCGCSGSQDTIGVFLDPRGAQMALEEVLRVAEKTGWPRRWELEIEEIEIGVLL